MCSLTFGLLLGPSPLEGAGVSDFRISVCTTSVNSVAPNAFCVASVLLYSLCPGSCVVAAAVAF